VGPERGPRVLPVKSMPLALRTRRHDVQTTGAPGSGT
jgi:hypothetical protein